MDAVSPSTERIALYLFVPNEARLATGLPTDKICFQSLTGSSEKGRVTRIGIPTDDLVVPKVQKIRTKLKAPLVGEAFYNFLASR